MSNQIDNTQTETRTEGSLHGVVGERYWHEIDAKEQQSILDKPSMTVRKFMEQYRQPDWCNYPEALGGAMGCWSLLSPGTVRSVESCKGCDECKAKLPNDQAQRPTAKQSEL